LGSSTNEKGIKMKEKIEAAVWGSFIADALALGVHWVYNTRVIDKKFGRVDGYQDPLTSYHKGKKAGEQTHFGDQMLVLLESVAAVNGFDLIDFSGRWRELFESYNGYFDGATKETLQHLSDGRDINSCGSSSDDLAGASRLAPLFWVYPQNQEALVAAVQKQTAFTHNHADVIAAAEFLARTTAAVLAGANPLAAVENVVSDYFKGSAIETLVADGLDSRELDTRQAIADFGQACSTDETLPGVMHLLARYTDDFKEALVENIMAGGDSAARGMPVAMILGAHLGMDAIPESWLVGLAARKRIAQLLA
jgi:ADP-ribosylglycohydrolase